MASVATPSGSPDTWRQRADWCSPRLLAKSKLRIGIVGTGSMASQHAEHFSKIKGVVLASCLDVVPRRAEEFAQKYGVARAASRLEDLLDEVDAVALVTSDRLHCEG